MEETTPKIRYSLTADYQKSHWRILGRVNYFGGIFEDHIESGSLDVNKGGLPIENIGAEYTVDLELSRQFMNNLTLTVGAQNLLDERPDENVLYDTEVSGSRYPLSSPIGINGGFYYARASYSF